jgi:hypothetical protein
MESDVVVAAGDHVTQRLGCGEEQRMGLRRVLQHYVLGVLVQHLPTAPSALKSKYKIIKI